jgi:hypothetical protein
MAALLRGSRVACVLLLCAATGGCVVYTVAATAVDVGATAVGVTADVVGGAVDLVVPDGDED